MFLLQGMTHQSGVMGPEDKIVNVHASTRMLMICGAVAFAAILVLNIILFVRLLPLHSKYETPLGNFPTPVILNRVPGQTGPAARLGDVTVLQQERCVNKTTKIIVQTIWTSSNSPVSVANQEQLKSNVMQGCATITMALQMPEKITPGVWLIQGIVRDEPSGDVRYWASEIFVVVP